MPINARSHRRKIHSNRRTLPSTGSLRRSCSFIYSQAFFVIAFVSPRTDRSAVHDDVIHLEQLEIHARVGVSDEERALPQRLVVLLTVWPLADFDALRDDLSQTVDYATVAKAVCSFVSERKDRLIETLASALASHLLGAFPIRQIRIELRKFVVPDCEHVAVVITRTAD